MIYSLESQSIGFPAMLFSQIHGKNVDVLFCANKILASHIKQQFLARNGILPKIMCMSDIPSKHGNSKIEMVLSIARHLPFERSDAIDFASDALNIISKMHYSDISIADFFSHVPYEVHGRFESNIQHFSKVYKLAQQFEKPYYALKKDSIESFAIKCNEDGLSVALAGIFPFSHEAKVLAGILKKCNVFLYNASNIDGLQDVTQVQYGRDIGGIVVGGEDGAALISNIVCNNSHDAQYNAAMHAMDLLEQESSKPVYIVTDENPYIICQYLQKSNVPYMSDFAFAKMDNFYIKLLFAAFDFLSAPNDLLKSVALREALGLEHVTNEVASSEYFPFLNDIAALSGVASDVYLKIYSIITNAAKHKDIEDFRDFLFFTKSETLNMVFESYHQVYEAMQSVTWKFWRKSRNAAVYIMQPEVACHLDCEHVIIINSDATQRSDSLFSKKFLDRVGIEKEFNEHEFAMNNVQKLAKSIVMIGTEDVVGDIVDGYDIVRNEYHNKCTQIQHVDVFDKPATISITAMEQYMEDPFTFYMKHIAKIRPSIHFSADDGHRIIGSAVHNIIEMYIKTQKNILECARIICDAKGLGHIVPFFSNALVTIAEEIGSGASSEETVVAMIDEVQVSARIDALTDSAIIDFKTSGKGSYNANMARRGHQLQLTFVNYALRSNREMYYFILESELTKKHIKIDMDKSYIDFDANIRTLVGLCTGNIFVNQKLDRADDYFALKRE